jgi:hypothetical protein
MGEAGAELPITIGGELREHGARTYDDEAIATAAAGTQRMSKREPTQAEITRYGGAVEGYFAACRAIARGDLA